MTFKRPAYEQVTIAHGGNTVTLRPYLQAACTLEARYSLPALYEALQEHNFTIIKDIILMTSSSGYQDAAAFLSSIIGKPLSHFFRTVQQPLSELLIMFTPAPVKQAHTATPANFMTWADVYAALYDRATGWLHWTPETAWKATPTEINRAYMAHVEQLKTIHGSTDDQDTKQPDPHQAERNIADGLDPEFDREGLHALKYKGKVR